MNQFFKLFFGLTFICISSSSFAQDTILLISGEEIITSNAEFNDSYNNFTFVNKANKIKMLDFDVVFSIRSKNGIEKVYYTPDSINDGGSFLYSEVEMRDYMKGRVCASKKTEAIGMATTAAFLGFGSTFLEYTPIIPIVPVAGVALLNLLPVKKKNILKKYPQYSGNIAFVDGYKDSAESVRSKRAIRGVLAGFVVGIVYRTVSETINSSD